MYNPIEIKKIMTGSSRSSGDATDSFSGYLYQADLALLLALEKIIELKDNPNELKKWQLEVEGEEDFTLTKIELSGSIIEKHSYQAKETSGKTPSDYTIAVIKLYEKNDGGGHFSYLITENDLSAKPKIDFFNGIYNGTELTDAKDKVNFFGSSNCNLLRLKMDPEYPAVPNGKRYKFKNGETKITIHDYITNETADFLNDKFECLYRGTWDEVHTQIESSIQVIRPSILEPKNYLRYFESIIKQYIQSNKGLDFASRNKLNLYNEIYEKIVAVDRLTFTSDICQDIFRNTFIKKFKEEFNEFYIGGSQAGDGEISNIISDFHDNSNFTQFLNNIILLLSNTVFTNRLKTYGLINITLCDEEIEKFINNTKVNHNELLRACSSIGADPIIQKIHLLIMYFFAKIHNQSLLDSYSADNDKLYITQGDFQGILTGLPLSNKGRCKKFLRTHTYYNYEQTHLGIHGVTDSVTLDEYIGNNGKTGESDFFNIDTEVNRKHLNQANNITKSKQIKIFGGQRCGPTSAHEFMS